jgi:polar amino acid transport system substrate-binding protein
MKILNRWLFSILISFLLFPQSSFGAELREIIQRGKLIVGVKDNLRPLGFYNTQGQLQGLEIDIAKHLAEELLGNPEAIILKPVSNQERLQVLLEGKVDLVIARVTQTSSRSRLVQFSPYYYFDTTGLVTKNPSIQQLSDLTTRKIAVLNNSSTIAVIRFEFPQAQLLGVNSYQEALNLLENAQADAFAADNSLLSGWVQEYPHYRHLSVSLAGAPLGVVMPKGLQYDSLRDRVEGAIAGWRKSGWLEQRAKYWGLINEQ